MGVTVENQDNYEVHTDQDWKDWLLKVSSDGALYNVPSKWFYLENLQVYLRYGRKVVNQRVELVVTISNVSAAEIGKGHFKHFIIALEQFVKENKLVAVYVENVINEKLYQMLIHHGYQIIGSTKIGDTRVETQFIKHL